MLPGSVPGQGARRNERGRVPEDPPRWSEPEASGQRMTIACRVTVPLPEVSRMK